MRAATRSLAAGAALALVVVLPFRLEGESPSSTAVSKAGRVAAPGAREAGRGTHEPARAARPAHRRRFVIGRSVRGRTIRAVRVGEPSAPRTILVVGCVHGDECAGRAVVRLLARGPAPPRTQLWLVPDLNPDGSRAGTRQNARGVDLNRNFPRRWRPGGSRGDRYFPGRSALSEPESAAAATLVRRLRPHAAVWFHQPLGLVNLSAGADPAVVRGYARGVGLPVDRLPDYRGTAPAWHNQVVPGASAFVVELVAGRLGERAARRHARAVLALAAWPAARALLGPRPEVVRRPIPFGRERRRQMRRYARRHYGLATHLLRRPRVIVEHYTAGDTFASAYATFARNAPDPELHELPGVCAHFVIDRDGTTYELVPVTLMCRHTIGLNHVAIGIEHVGRTDAEVMGSPAQRRASLRLTRWLQRRHGIATADVIGHAESLSSRHHRERVERLRDRTHADFAPATMRRYRRLLRRSFRTPAGQAGTRERST